MSSSAPTPDLPTSGGAGRGGGRNRNRKGRGNTPTTASTATGKDVVPVDPIADVGKHYFAAPGESVTRTKFKTTSDALKSWLALSPKVKFPQDLDPLFGEDVSEAILLPPIKPVPKKETGDYDKLELGDYERDRAKYERHEEALESALAILHDAIMRQCTEAMQAKVRAQPGYSDAAKRHDCFWFFTAIKAITHMFDGTALPFVSLLSARLKMLSCKQKPEDTVEVFYNNMASYAKVVEAYGGQVAETPIVEPGKSKLTPDAARERTLAILLIVNADPARFSQLQTDLQNSYILNRDEYPVDCAAACALLTNYKLPSGARGRTSGNPAAVRPSAVPSPEASAMTFVQAGHVKGDDASYFSHITCHKCNCVGHYADHCPQKVDAAAPPASGTTLVQHSSFVLAQADESAIDPAWILLDSQSTVSVFCNPSYLSNIRPSPRILHARTNGGHQDSSLIGDFPNLGPVWYNPASIANILSLSEVLSVCEVSMNSAVEKAMLVHRLDGSIMKFEQHPCGLFVFSPNDSSVVSAYSDYTFLTTVESRKKEFSPRERQLAADARAFSRTIGRPSQAELEFILANNLVLNCPVTVDDAKRAFYIWGPDIATVKGTTRRGKAAAHIPDYRAVPIPSPILEFHRDVILCADFFFVQGLPFYHSISRDIGYRTVSPVSDLTKATILAETKKVVQVYRARGFVVQAMHADNAFECIRNALLPIELDCPAPDSHVGEVERSVQTVKDRLRSGVHGLPFRRLPKVLIQELVQHVTNCLNMFPRKNGISTTMSPTTIVTGRGLPNFHSFSLEFGTYVQIFDDNNPSNTMRARTLGAIALRPTGNANGDYYFLSLATGERVIRHSWTVIHMTETAIARVDAIAAHEGRPLIQDGLVIEWRPDMPIDDDTYDLDYVPPIDENDDDLDGNFLPVEDDELAELDDFDDSASADPPSDDPIPDGLVPGAIDAEFEHGEPNNGHIFELGANEVESGAPDLGLGAPADGNEFDGDIDAPVFADDDDNGTALLEPGAELFAPLVETVVDDAVVPDDDADVPVDADDADDNAVNPRDVLRSHIYNLRARRTGTARFANAIDEPHSSKSYFPPVQLLQMAIDTLDDVDTLGDPNVTQPMRRLLFAYVLTQMSEKAGLRKHGKAAEDAMLREFSQLKDLSVFAPMYAHELTPEQRRAALRAINLIKEKRDGTIKGRTVADGRPQRSLYEKSETASPTVSSDALFATIVIDAKEGRDTAVADVVGAYLKALMKDLVIMKFTGTAVDIICKMDPSYEAYVTVENGKKVIYVRLHKALYGCVQSALLWYNLFSESLIEMGFVLNPYDQCVANCMIDGSQCTIAWYVDDTKISHRDPNVVTRIIECIEAKFGKMSVSRGKEHEFLGLKLRYNDDGTATISMKEHLKDAISSSGLGIVRTASTPAKRSLFEVDEGSPLLSKSRAEIFHRTAAKLLYVAMRARMDVLLPTCFLCTRVSKCTDEDELKLRRLLEYINGTLELEYTLGADDLCKLQTWVDASYAVHPDMRSHTGGMMSFGTGGLVCKSVKQKLNTKSSTEAELVGVSDYLPNTIWMNMFMEGQGYKLTENILHQDNESAIKLEKNGRMSAGPKSKHVKIRYFWVKDVMKSDGMEIRHCPTLKMLADFFTKPLQGQLFYKLRDVILGYKHISSLTVAPSDEERVGSGRDERAPAYVENVNESGVTPAVPADAEGDAEEVSSKQVSWVDIVKGGFESAHSLETIPV